MRLKNKLGTIATALGVELCILAFVGLVFLFQFDKAKVELVNKTKAISETIGEQASSFFSQRMKAGTSDEFFQFLDQRLGRKKLFNTFDVAPKFFSVVLRRDVESGKVADDIKDDFYPKKGYTVSNQHGMISVSVPFAIQGQSEPFGIVKIDSDTQAIRAKVLADNSLLYAAILVVLNNQVFILYLLLRRRKEVIFEKGYLREHSVGALKIMYRVLGDIIQDHEGAGEPSAKQGESKKVISISELVEKRKK
ncbi:MAG TPA: hypothetical protein VI935_07105 [Thermodesulfobacteriota bacterium]|nr:hypothetical protein [Thermodesulfobacteriota bacterium]